MAQDTSRAVMGLLIAVAILVGVMLLSKTVSYVSPDEEGFNPYTVSGSK